MNLKDAHGFSPALEKTNCGSDESRIGSRNDVKVGKSTDVKVLVTCPHCKEKLYVDREGKWSCPCCKDNFIHTGHNINFHTDKDAQGFSPALEELLRDGKWQILNKVMRSIRSWNLPQGDYLEFGLYQGMSFIHAYNLAKSYGNDFMRFYGFDSFQGLPDEVTKPERKYDHFYPGQFGCSEKEFRQILANSGVDFAKIGLIAGFFGETLNDELKKALPIRRAAVVWIDVDLYSSTIPVLDFVTDYLTTGSFLIFDDWFSFGADPNAGELRATRELLARHPGIELAEYHKFHTAGMSFLVQRNN